MVLAESDGECDNSAMKRTAWGLTAMFVSFLLGTVIALGSLTAMGGRLNSDALTAFSAPTLLVTCLDPLVILLEIGAIVLIVMDSRRFGDLHRRMAWAAAIFFGVWTVANFGVFLPLSFVGMQRGSLSMVQAGQWVKAGAAVLQYAIPFLLAFGLTRGAPRALLWVALALSVAGNFGVVALTVGGMELRPVGAFGGTELYAPYFNVDYTTGPYPILLALGYLGGGVYMVVYGVLAWRRRMDFKRAEPG